MSTSHIPGAPRTRRPAEQTEPAPGGEDVSDALVSRRLLILANVLKRASGLRYRRMLDLAGGEWGVIANLGGQPPMSLNALSNRIGLDKTQLSKSVSRLVKRGLVLRRVRPDNNRQILLSLTAAGSECYRRILQAAGQANETLLEGVSAAERDNLVRRIDLLTERARALLQIEIDLGSLAGEPDPG